MVRRKLRGPRVEPEDGTVVEQGLVVEHGTVAKHGLVVKKAFARVQCGSRVPTVRFGTVWP